MKSLEEFLHAHGAPIDTPSDGQIHRFDRAGPLTGWVVIKAHTLANGKLIVVSWVGDHKTQEKYSFNSAKDMPKEEFEKIQAELLEKEKEARAEQDARHEEAATRMQKFWSELTSEETTEYHEKKGLTKTYGARTKNQFTYVPAYDLDGKLWTLQGIAADGKKQFAKGGKYSGCFYPIGNHTNATKIILCEGYATGASLYEALNDGTTAVLVTFSAKNLITVAKTFSKIKKSYVIAADHDQFTTDTKGNPWNPGLESGSEAARILQAPLFFPAFTDLSTKPTDWNDYHQEHGAGAIQSIFGATPLKKAPIINQVLDFGPGSKNIQPLPIRWNKNGTLKKIVESEIVDRFLSYYEHDLLQQDGDIFQWVGTHWKIYGEKQINQVKNALNFIANNQLSYHQIQSAYAHLLIRTRTTEQNLLNPRRMLTNFLDGTLHGEPTEDGGHTLVFRPHSKTDYCSQVIPLEYLKAEGAVNQEFQDMLQRVFKDDADRNQKIQALKEMYGVCLMPYQPHIFLLVGGQGTGKSTLILTAQKLIHRDNWGTLEPREFDKPFALEAILGKMVNIDTDIDTRRPISDSKIKKIEDGENYRIDRKYQQPVYAPIPAIHIFGGNEIPPTGDGSSGAHERRWTFIRMEHSQLNGGGYRKNYAEWMFRQSPEGILAFALEGLRDVISKGGHFTQPESGVREMREWQLDSDTVGQFLAEISEGEVRSKNGDFLVQRENSKIERKELFETYCQWVEETRSRGYGPGLPKKKFFAKVRAKTFKESKIDGVWYFKGVGCHSADSVC